MSLSFEPLPMAEDVGFTEEKLVVALKDGRRISVPVAWFPRLADAPCESWKTGSSSATARAFTGPISTRTSASPACCTTADMMQGWECMTTLRNVAVWSRLRLVRLVWSAV